MNRYYFLLLAAVFLSALSCSNDLDIGSSLLDDQTINVAFTDTVAITSKTILGDSALTYFESAFFTKRTHMIGKMDDPIFGTSEATLYANAFIENSNLVFDDNFTIDSVILVLPFDTLGTYGDFNTTFNIEVFQLDQSLFDIVEEKDTLTSNMGFPYGNLLGSTSVVPNFIDSFEIKVPINDTISTQNVPKHIRISLDPQLGQSILADSNITKTDTTFQAFVRGFAMKTDGANNAMLGINMIPGEGALFIVYFTTEDDKKKVFNVKLGGIRHNELIHDYSGTEVEMALLNTGSSDLIYVQSMAGVNGSFDLSAVKDIGNKLINKAELEITLVDLNDYETDIYTPINNLLTSYRNDDNRLMFTDDINVLNTILNRNPSIEEIEAAYGGNILEDDMTGIRTYKFNITNHIIDIIKGEVTTTEFELLSYLKQQRPNRSVIYGPNYPDDNLKAKLKLVLTSP